jgi:predicted DNA-binding transcriptional regulator AlpA
MESADFILDQLREKLGGRSRSSIYRDIENGHVPIPIRIGARLYWIDEEVDDFLETRRFGRF